MGELKVGRLAVGMYATNCYFVYREGTPDCLVFDAPDHGKEVAAKLEENGLHIRGIFLTHGHFDHIWGASDLRIAASAYAEKRGEGGVKIYALDAEAHLLSDSDANVSAQMGRPCSVRPNTWVKDGEEIELAGMKLKVIATPGHTEGSCCYYFEESGILIAGDTLFEESVGRTDFPTGSGATLSRSIREKLFTLPENTIVYPGHGGTTTIGHEMACNPFVGDGVL